MSLTNMCRLCLSKDNLVWVFDKRFENTNNMKQIIYVTTGVEIFTTDAVSQSICKKCCHIIINMFEFRKKSLENDKQLKEIQKTLQSANTNLTNVQIKEEQLDIPIETKKDVHQPSMIIHPTVKELYDTYPHIKIQRLCLTADIKPLVVMQMNAVENYYNERNLNFEEHCVLALQRRTTARKKTSAFSRTQYNRPPCPINGQIIHSKEEDTEEGVLRPIKIKIIPKTSITEKAAEETNNILKMTEVNSDAQETKKTASCHRKRKYSEVMESPTKENENPELDHSANLLKRSESLSYVANVSMPLYTCNICDAIQNNPKDLKKHRNKHLRCTFCRSIFRSLESKAQHLEDGCLIKKAMHNFPCIELSKVETNIDIVKKFPNAFADICPVVNIKNNECYEILCSESDMEYMDSSTKPVKHITDEDTVDVIEILSDDDDAMPANFSSINSQDVHPPAKIPKLTPTIKPNVKIKDNPFTDLISSSPNEIIMLQNLLNSSKAVQMSEDRGIQTDSPNSHGIEVDEGGQTALLINFKQHLNIFQIPIVIKRGPFCVSYSHMDKPKSKNLQLWSGLVPVDITKNNTKVMAAHHTTRYIPSLSTSEEAKVPKSAPLIVTRPTVGNKSCVNVDIPHTLVSKDSKTTCDENYNSLSNSETTTVVSIARPVISTHNHISVIGPSATSALPSSRNTAKSTCTKKVVDSPASPSTTVSTNPTTVSANPTIVSANESITVSANPSTTVSAYQSTTVFAYQSTTVSANPSTTVSAYQLTTVSANPSTTVPAYQSTTVSANPSTTVSAYQSTTISANPSTTVPAYQSTTVSANPSTTVPAYQSTTIFANPSTTVSVCPSTIISNRPTSVIQWKPSSDASRSHSGPQNTTTTSKDNIDKPLANSPVASTLSSPASYQIPPNTSVYNIPHVGPPTSAVPDELLKYTFSQRHNITSNSSNTFSNTRNHIFFKQSEIAQTSDCIYSGKGTNKDSQRPPTAFVVNNRKTPNTLNVMPQSINTNLNKSIENVCTTTTSRSSHLPLCKPVNVNNTYWPPSSSFTVGPSNVPVMAVDKCKNSIVDPRYVSMSISQPVHLPHSTSESGYGVSYATTQPNSMQYVPVRNKIDVGRNYLPPRTFKTALPPPYSIAETSLSHNINCTLPHQTVNTINNWENSFANSVNTVTLSQHSSSTKFPVNNNSGISDTVAVSYLNTSSLSTTLPQVNPNSCSVTTSQIGHIRVKNMQELT